jgi:peptidoglycan hydrolase-like protein with peptidoglycan-binding domain
MTEADVLQKMLDERTDRLHRCQAQHAELSAGNRHNDPQALSLLTELFENWGGWVQHGVFDHNLTELVHQFQDTHGVHPADGVVRASTWAGFAAMLQAEVTDLTHKVAAASGHGHHDHHAPADHPTWGSDDGTGHYQGPVNLHPPHPDAHQLHGYVDHATRLLHSCSDPSRPDLHAHGHNDSGWVSAVIDCFRMFDLINGFDTVNPGLGWGSDGMQDGDYGHNLQNAVHRYQEVNGVHPSGDVDAATWNALVADLHGVVQSLQQRLTA